MSVNPSQFDTIAKLLDVAAIRQRVIAQNVANVNTPGYHRKHVSFEEELSRMLQEGDAAAVGKLEATVVETEGLSERADGNNVDIDQEMAVLTQNSVLYETYSQILATKIGMMRSAINGQP